MDIKNTLIFDVCVTDPVSVNPEIFNLWLAGYNAVEAFSRHKEMILELYRTKHYNLSQRQLYRLSSCIQRDVEDEYRTYGIIEPMLIDHEVLRNDLLMVQIGTELHGFLVEKYYEFDEVVYRHLIGKKLSSKDRKDLSVLEDEVGINLTSLHRQFDNFKRVKDFCIANDSSTVISRLSVLNKTNLLSNRFKIPNSMADRYVRLMMLSLPRFDCITGRLSSITFKDLDNVAGFLLSWSDERNFGVDSDFISKVASVCSII